jgi:hypothetical protein
MAVVVAEGGERRTEAAVMSSWMSRWPLREK